MPCSCHIEESNSSSFYNQLLPPSVYTFFREDIKKNLLKLFKIIPGSLRRYKSFHKTDSHSSSSILVTAGKLPNLFQSASTLKLQTHLLGSPSPRHENNITKGLFTCGLTYFFLSRPVGNRVAHL